jgi:hypothetical protein
LDWHFGIKPFNIPLKAAEKKRNEMEPMKQNEMQQTCLFSYPAALEVAIWMSPAWQLVHRLAGLLLARRFLAFLSFCDAKRLVVSSIGFTELSSSHLYAHLGCYPLRHPALAWCCFVLF